WGIDVSARVSRAGAVPTRAFVNATPLDLSRDFLPLGDQPRLNDAFYVALPEEAARPKSTVAVSLTLSAPPPAPIKPSKDLKVTWEAWDGTAWKPLTITQKPAAKQVSKDDATPVASGVFTADGTVTLTLPDTLAPRSVNGEDAFWIRARLTAG